MSEYEEAVEYHLKGCRAESVGLCPGCEVCHETFAPDDTTMEEFNEMWTLGEVCDEGSFSHWGCGICGTTLGGTRFVWHWVDENDEIQHEDDCCIDCAMYLANGEEPENWRRS